MVGTIGFEESPFIVKQLNTKDLTKKETAKNGGFWRLVAVRTPFYRH